MNVRRRMALLTVIAAAVACEEAQDEAASEIVERVVAAGGRKAEVTVDRERSSVTVKLGAAIVPKEWPKGVPISPDAHRLRADHAKGNEWNLSVRAGVPPQRLEGFYREELERGGWRVEAPSSDGKLRARRGAARLVASFAPRREGRESRATIELVMGS